MATGKQNKIYGNPNWRPLKVRDTLQFVRGNVSGFAHEGSEVNTANVAGPNSTPGGSPDVPFVIGVFSAFSEAAQPGNIRAIDSELLFNYAGSTFVAVNPTGIDGQPTSANQNTSPASIAAVRGAVTVGGTYTGSTGGTAGVDPSRVTATTITGGFLYGVQGKLIIRGTIDTTNGEVQAAVVAQLDTSAATLTAGTIAALWIDGGSTSNLTSAQFDMIFMSNTTLTNAGAVINFAGNAADLFVLNTQNAVAGSFLRPTTTVSTQVGSMAISYWNGAAMVTGYIPIYSS